MSETIRFDINLAAPVDYGSLPPLVWIAEYPPHPGESAREYRSRVQAEILCEIYRPKPSLFARFWAWFTSL